MIECPSCGKRQEPRLTCLDCGAPLAAPLDCFAALALPRRLVIDLGDLERRYHDLSRKLHPDRFASRGPKVRDASLLATATLTRSYRTLRDPVARGLYWLELNGEKLAENNKRVPPEMAELVFEVQEQIAEMQLSDDPEAAHERATEISARRIELQFKMDELLTTLDRNFAGWDQSGDAKALATELKTILSNIAYLRTLIRDVDRALDNAKAA
jgi:molecular chaperone HscB